MQKPNRNPQVIINSNWIFTIIFCVKKPFVNRHLAKFLTKKTVNEYLYDNSVFIYTRCMDASQSKPNQYINGTQKVLLRIVNKDHESSFKRILTTRQQF